jgi:putative addiction module component (TIGR02574 family)
LFAQFIPVAAQLILICDSTLFCFIKAMTIRALEKEVLELPPKSRARFAEKIIESIDDYAGPEIEKAWTQEIGRRVEEIKSGKASGIPADEAMTKARRALHETRRLSPARR